MAQVRRRARLRASPCAVPGKELFDQNDFPVSRRIFERAVTMARRLDVAVQVVISVLATKRRSMAPMSGAS
jgi:hypothetical protein